MANPVIAVGLCAVLLCGCGGSTKEKDTRKAEEAKTAQIQGNESENLTETLTSALPENEDAASDTEKGQNAGVTGNTAKKRNDEETAAEEDTSAENTSSEVPLTEKPAEALEKVQASEEKGAVPAAETQGEIPREEGMLSKPSHSENTSGRDLIFIGDSRTEAMRDAVGDDSTWCCKSGMGYAWMSSTAVPSIENQIGENTAVIILMGVNDVSQVTNYVNYINIKANEWANLGAQTYFASVGPVESDPYVTNKQIESFNDLMEANLIGVNYIDVYSHLVSVGYSTVDGTHYPDSVSVEIYNYILDNLEEPTEGIWG